MSESAEGTLQALAKLIPTLRPRQILVVSQVAGGAPDLLRLQLTESLRDDFMRSDSANCREWVERTPMKYILGRSVPGGHVMWADRSTVTLLSELNLEDDSARNIPPFDLKTLSATNLKMTITTSAPQNETSKRVTFFRITRNTARLARSRRFAAIFRNGSFDSLEDEVLFFNFDVDAIAFGDYIFFSNRHMFERSFNFLEALREEAAETFEMTTQKLEIGNLDGFRRSATTDINMMAKMASIRRKLDADPRYARAMNMPNLLKFIDSNSHIEVPLTGEGAKRQFEFQSSPTMRYKILKLLDDDFLKSGLTFLDYEVDSKSDPI